MYITDNKKTIVIILGFILSIALGFWSIGEEVATVIRWFLGLFILGMAAWPLNKLILKPLNRDGYYYSKILGMALSSYIMWLLSSLGILRFNIINSYISAVLVAAIGTALIFIVRKRRKLSEPANNRLYLIDYALRELILFNLLLIIAVFISLKVPATETERLMDFGFMKTISLTEYMPPLDMWASGHNINYYYYGQYLCTYICKIALVDVEEGYTLAMATIYCFCAILSYTAVKTLLYKRTNNLLTSNLGGVLGGILVSTCGNMHYVIFGKLVPALWDILQIPGEKPGFWMADSTRYIGYVPVNEADRTIHEFPFYSFLIGDLHAHVIDIIIVLTILGLLISYVYQYNEIEYISNESFSLNDILNPHIILLGFLIGIASMTNFWDYPIYYCVAGCIILFMDIRRIRKPRKVVIIIALQGAIVWTFSQIVNLPFRLKFQNMTSGIALAKTHSLPHQLIVLWGLPIFTCIVFYSYIYFIKSRINKTYITDIFVLLISLCGLGLILMPELIYVIDIYGAGFPRANTMFKLTYQAYMLLGICAAYIIAVLIYQYLIFKHKAWQIEDLLLLKHFEPYFKYSIIILFLYICTVFYAYTASHQWFGQNSYDWSFKGLDSTSSIRSNMGSDALALEWIEANVKGQQIILEAPGLSYTSGNTISALSGRPTVIGWQTHEWLWHNSYDYVYLREIDVNNIYTSADADVIKEGIDKYHIDYIYIGKNEYSKYGVIELDSLLQFGELAFSDGSQIDPIMIIKINK